MIPSRVHGHQLCVDDDDDDDDDDDGDGGDDDGDGDGDGDGVGDGDDDDDGVEKRVTARGLRPDPSSCLSTGPCDDDDHDDENEGDMRWNTHPQFTFAHHVEHDKRPVFALGVSVHRHGV